jgi:hypothetical protein
MLWLMLAIVSQYDWFASRALAFWLRAAISIARMVSVSPAPWASSCDSVSERSRTAFDIPASSVPEAAISLFSAAVSYSLRHVFSRVDVSMSICR